MYHIKLWTRITSLEKWASVQAPTPRYHHILKPMDSPQNPHCLFPMGSMRWGLLIRKGTLKILQEKPRFEAKRLSARWIT